MSDPLLLSLYFYLVPAVYSKQVRHLMANMQTVFDLFYQSTIEKFNQSIVSIEIGKSKGKGQLNSEWIYDVIISPKMAAKILRISALEAY